MVTIIAPLPAPQYPQVFVLFEWATACFAYYLIYSEVPFLGHLQTLAIHLKVHIFICCSIFSWFWPFSAWNFHKHPRLCLSSHSFPHLPRWKSPEEINCFPWGWSHSSHGWSNKSPKTASGWVWWTGIGSSTFSATKRVCAVGTSALLLQPFWLAR